MKEICMYCQHALYHPYRHHTFPCKLWTERASIVQLDQDGRVITSGTVYEDAIGVHYPIMVSFSSSCKEFTKNEKL